MRLAQSLGFAVLVVVSIFLKSGSDVQAQAKIDFAKDIEPIFQKSCYSCHGPKAQMSGLRLDEKKAAFAGGNSGPAIVPGKASESALYQRVAGIVRSRILN